MNLIARYRLAAIVIVASVFAGVAAYELPGRSADVQTAGTFTADNIIANTSIQDKGLTATKIVATDGSKNLTSMTDVTCSGSGSAITAITGAGFTCGAVASASTNSGLFNGTAISPIPTQAGLSFTSWNTDANATFTNVDQGINFAATGSTSAESAITTAAPATPYTVTAMLTYNWPGGANAGNWGIGWSSGASGTSGSQTAQWLIYCPACSGGFQQRIFNATNATTVSSLINQSAAIIRSSGAGVPWFLRLKDDGTTVTYQISFDGIGYTTVYSVAKASGFLGAGGYSRIGFVVNDAVSGTYVTLLSWKVTSP